MQTHNTGYRSLSYLVGLNVDRILFVAAILAALWVGSILGSI